MDKYKYNMEQLISTFETGEPIPFIYFWGHSSTDLTTVKKQCLSQWYNAGFTLYDVYYPTSEHWMMAQKAKLFNDTDMFFKIVESKDPKEAKRLGRKIKFFNPDVWNNYKYRIVVEGNLQKFTQNPTLFDFIKSTGNSYLIEASPNDSIWGIGISEKDENINNPYVWKGQNLLGFALMEVRDRLKDLENFQPLKNTMPTPGLKFPNIDPYDLFWRMGKGEDYLNQFSQWFNSLTSIEQQIYKISHPNPISWGVEEYYGYW